LTITYDPVKDAYVDDTAALLQWEHELSQPDYADWYLDTQLRKSAQLEGAR
jgi:hypothetical protein